MTERVEANAAAQSPSLEQRARVDVMQLFLAHWRPMMATLVLITVAVTLAWRDQLPLHVRVAWCGALFLDYLWQGAVCYRMQHSASPAEAVTRWLPWLVAAIAGSAILWALLPWLIPNPSEQVLLFACLMNGLMLYAIVNTPGTPSMFFSAVIPIGLLDTLVLVRHEALIYASMGFAIMVGLILMYGLRHLAVLRAGMVARYIAEDLAHDLKINQQRLIELEHERTLLLERERLTRDMHDGLGSTLVASLVAVERGVIQPERLAETLRECVDDLRSVIDSLEPIDHDLVALLSTLRYRFESRLDGAGLLLVWEMEDLPALIWLGPPEALHVMRIMQEVLINVIQHAAATCIRVAAHVAGADVEVIIVDDGKGFDPAATSNGRGMPSLRHRAAFLGGSIDIDSGKGRGTRVSLRLPIVKSGKLS